VLNVPFYISRRKIVELLTDHITHKNEDTNYFVKAGFELLKLASNVVLGSIAAIFDEATKGVSYLRIDDTNRWKRYDPNGNLNDAYNPLLPGYGLIKDLQKMLESESVIKKKKSSEKDVNDIISKGSLLSFERGITKSQEDLRSSVNNLEVSSLIKFAKKKLQGVFKFLADVKSLIKKVVKLILNGLEKVFIYCNAFIIGLYNSIIDAVAGILQLISMICKGVNALVEVGSKVLQNPGTYFSLFLEMFENGMETIAKLFSIQNVVLFMTFIYQLVISYIFPSKENDKFLDSIGKKIEDKYNTVKKKVSEIDIGITYDQLGYGIGYIVGFIISEVALTIATGGAKTVATALQVTAKGYLSIIRGIGKIPKLAASSVIKLTSFSFRFVIKLMRYIRNLVIKLPKILKKLANWFNEVSTVARKALDDAYRAFFTTSEQSLLKQMGLKPSKVNNGKLTLCPIK
jgi:hypothetical protein